MFNTKKNKNIQQLCLWKSDWETGYEYVSGNDLPLQQQLLRRPQEWYRDCPSASPVPHPHSPVEERSSEGKEAGNLRISRLKIHNISLLVHAQLNPVTCYATFHSSFSRGRQDHCHPVSLMWKTFSSIISRGAKTRWLQWNLHEPQTYSLTCLWTGQSADVAVPFTTTSSLQKPVFSSASLELLEQEQGYAVMLLLIRMSFFSHSSAPSQPQQVS